MARQYLKEDEYLPALFESSDADEPSTVTFEADSVHDSLHDALTSQEEEEEAQLWPAEPDEDFADQQQDLAVLHAVRLHSLAPGPSSAAPGPSSASPVPHVESPVSSAESPVSSAASHVPPAASPVLPAASPAAVHVLALSPVELRNRKRRRGPLHPAKGVTLKRFSDDSYKAKDTI